ncbi:MAG TPA: hypothetical protein VMS01_03735 [Stellaceae bacterium]|nr:hypothetical protein [Stellaceae bacterium]
MADFFDLARRPDRAAFDRVPINQLWLGRRRRTPSRWSSLSW